MSLTDDLNGANAARSFVWNVGTLSWDRAIQATGGVGGGGDASAENQLIEISALNAIYTETATSASRSAYLPTIDASVAKIPSPGQALSAASMPVVLPAAQITTLTPPAAITGFALEAGHLATIDTKTPALGQALAAASTPVVLTAIQQAALTPPAAITGFLTEADFDTKAGALLEAAPASDTASSGLNGRLQRIAQRITSLIALLPTALSNGFFQVSLKESIALTVSGTVTASGPLTDTQLRASAVPVSGPLTDTQVRATPLPVSGTVAVTNLDVALSTRLKPADTLTGVTTVATLTSITNPVAVTAPTLTKGAQGANGFTTQDLKDAGRNLITFFHAAPIITTTAEVMQTLTGYKSGAAVTATATPAVVTANKTFRINSIEIHYVAATAIGGALVRLRANTGGVAIISSPLVKTFQIGMAAAFTAGTAISYTFPYPDGLEFAAGTGIAIGVQGVGADGTTGTITGKVMVVINGYEY